MYEAIQKVSLDSSIREFSYYPSIKFRPNRGTPFNSHNKKTLVSGVKDNN